MTMKRLTGVLVLVFGLTACTAEPAGNHDKAPPGTVTRYESPTSAAPPTVVVREYSAVVTAALPTDADLPGYTRPAGDVPTILKLCPTIVETLTAEVHGAGAWQGTGGGTQPLVYVATVLDPLR